MTTHLARLTLRGIRHPLVQRASSIALSVSMCGLQFCGIDISSMISPGAL